ncbi:MAG TPA: adenylate/guanylate cyclase domain-containing protein [Mycobacterium sp.]|nr:adenylate/guanylate cyclase domain-containing protein [Mycobacterium sp.]
MTTVAACRTCGTEPLENARFCHGCGSPVDDGDTRAEYKQVTVLFADMVHSMDIAAAVGAERLREIMAELVDRSSMVVRRYGGTVDKFTGDGIMAVFGAPTALEDHALRGCLAALGIQDETKRLAVEVDRRDGVTLQLRVGLNSGQVIAGEIGSGATGYTAVGEQVGMAQRMESVAPAGGVMLSASTARLVEDAATLGESELVQIKGVHAPVPARRLLGMGDGHRAAWSAESNLVGRRWEMSAVEGLLERAIDGHGAVVGVVGSPGIGKSRIVREVSAMAAARGVDVFTAFCESHATDIPFRVLARLLRADTGIKGLDPHAARARIRAQAPDAEPEDLLLFDDLLGIADPEVELPKIDPDARRRRLTALVNAASLARQAPAVYVVEDVHWIDGVSESMLADFVAAIPQTHSLVLITYRPEYRGALSRVPAAHSIALAPLSDSETAALVTELLGQDSSVGGLAAMIVERAAGNPFFVEEMVRELAERGVLRGNRSAYVSTVGAAEVSVPATVQATIAARIDRLDPAAKRTLSAAAVIGSRFDPGLLETLGIEPIVEDLVVAELIDQVSFTRGPDYVFHHPLIRTVAYESQLKSDRAELHRRLAAVIEARSPAATDENAALIAEHLEAAGDLHAAYVRHMRAATWATNRDIAAARVSWERARQIADALPADAPGRTAMCITPRTMLCGTAFRVHASVSDRFDELRELCTAAGDKASLAIGMTGLAIESLWSARVHEASRLASEQMALLESIGDPSLTIGVAFLPMAIRFDTGDFADIFRWSQTVIDWADGDPAKGNLIVGSPLAVALVWRGLARFWLGRDGWRQDLDDAVVMARSTDPATYAMVVSYKYGFGIGAGVLLADDTAVREIEEAVQTAEGSSDDTALSFAKFVWGIALAPRRAPADRQRGLELVAQLRDRWLRERSFLHWIPIVDLYVAREQAARGDRDGAISVMRQAVDDLFTRGEFAYLLLGADATLVQTLLDRGADSDLAEAQEAIDRLANLPGDEGWVLRDITLLQLRALLAHARGDEAAYRDHRDRYRAMATSLGFEGHLKWAEAMP